MQNIEQRVEVETVQPLPPPAPPSSFAPGRYGVSPLIAAASGREQPGGASMQTHSAEEGQYNRRTKGRGCGDRRCRNLMDNAGGSNYGLCTKGLTDGDDGKEHTYNIYWTIALIALLHRDNRTSDHIQLNSKSIYEKVRVKIKISIEVVETIV
ncbi:hypothetical protein DdX_05464 [Ditylenchus destructor]|uniref:Uncharacterized protein n=1 Tax=Ditylenchus destructor TaxID=166010 RepID=A0AAD4N7B1_9BILA|nr:hypothetical protein DdX_05464 [Ditylenchus destructor]